MSRSIAVAALLSLALFPAGCAPAAAPVSPTASLPTSAPVAPTGSGQEVAPEGRTLSGRALGFDGPLAGAKVQAFAGAQRQLVGEASVGADGAFTLSLADAVPAGALVELVATLDGRSVASLTVAPAHRGGAVVRRVLAAESPLALTPATTLAFGLLQPRFRAAIRASIRESGADDATVFAALKALDSLRSAAEAALAKVSDSQAREAILHAVDAGGAALLDPVQGARLLAGSSALSAAFIGAADSLAQTIRQAVAKGATPPPVEWLNSVGFGAVQAGSVSLGTSSGGGSGGGGTPAPDPLPLPSNSATPIMSGVVN